MIPPGSQTEYLVETNGTNFSDDFLKDELGIDVNNVENQLDAIRPGGKQETVILNITAEEAAKVKKQPNVVSMAPYVNTLANTSRRYFSL
jgi:signal peptidase I